MIMKAIATKRPRGITQTIVLGIMITVIIIVSSILNPINAQTKLGFRGGLNISEPGLNTSIGNTAELTKSFTGIDIALVSEFGIASRISLLTELGYTEKGIRLGTGTNINVLGAAVPVGITTTTKIRQLELPVLAKYQLSHGLFRTYVTAGPTLGYALSGNFKTKGTLLSEIDLVNRNINLGEQNRFSLGLSGGLGLELDNGPGTLFMEARYQYQAMQVNNLPLDDVQFNNKGVGFNIGYKFTI